MEAFKDERKRYTSDEFLAMTGLPEHCELIDGYIYMSPSPSQKHQRIAKRLIGEIDRYIMAHKGNCEAFMAPSDVKLSDHFTVQPDVFVVCDPDKLDGHNCNGAPDWVIEILSPSNENLDMKKKMILYRNSGVREYWIVDPEEENVFVYLFGTPNITGFYTFDDDIPAGIYENSAQPLSICIKSLLEK